VFPHRQPRIWQGAPKSRSAECLTILTARSLSLQHHSREGPVRPREADIKVGVDIGCFVPRSNKPSGIFLRERFCDFARAIDEKLRHRTRFAVLQGDDADRCPSNRQVHSQFLDERMPTGKLQPELWNDREIATGAQKIGANFEGGGGDSGARIIKAAGAKSLGDERSECIVWRW
jgi:hypothetical protein